MKLKTIGSSLALLGMIASNSLPVHALGLTTVPQAITLASVMEGYSSLLWGLQDLEGIDTNFEENFSFDFNETNVSNFNFSGLLNNNPFILNYSGNLSGNFGSENMTWNGNWTGSYGNQSIQATDSATWFFDSGSNLYTSMNFQQDASLVPTLSGEVTPFGLFEWLVVGTEVLGTVAGGVVSGGWGAVGAGARLGLASVAILNPPTTTPPPTPPLPPVFPPPPMIPPGYEYEEVWTYDGTTGDQSKTQKLKPAENKPKPPENKYRLITTGNISCDPTKCSSDNYSNVEEVPEPSMVLGTLLMMGFGFVFRRKKVETAIDTGQ